MIIIVMGVAGSGKTTVGQLLASTLDWALYDADHFHPPGNMHKMASGTPLGDRDRGPWLEELRLLITNCLQQGENAVLACSALKGSCREHLSPGDEPVVWVYLKADRDLVRERLAERRDHYLPPDLLESQFETLEEPNGALVLPADLHPEEIVKRICSTLGM